MKNLKNLILTGIVAGSLGLNGCNLRGPIYVTPIPDLNKDEYSEGYIKRHGIFGVERTLLISKVIDGKVTYSEIEIDVNSKLYKKGFIFLENNKK